MARANKQSFAPLRRRNSDEGVRISMQRDRLGDGAPGGGGTTPPTGCLLGALIANYPCQTIHFNAAGIG